ncbi:signal transduction histidine kinase [Nonomuraea thailandensis]|uniref:histidine kinase n=1 Tax=Nonomuraea thailandensis TaxID=1188745 RepID=A0A9X2GQ40_9ACTN|nr:histidine kinase [Nonomuraea thailandensis]MCP2359626.1 signal transduction histidine kinase [Nonomuraea thailandensis]
MTELRGDGAATSEYRWALPSVLLGDGSAGGRVRRSTRDWIVDILMFLFACGLTFLSLVELDAQRTPELLMLIEQVAGALACVAVWLRRRWPVALAIVTGLLSSYLEMIGGASVVALFTVAVHRPFKISGPVTLLNLLTLAPYVILRPQSDLDRSWAAALGVAIVLTVFAWGIVIRARRQLVWSLRQRADSAAEEAKRLERERIAREMHDVLAHRISMLSLHAGALEFRPDAPPGEIARAAGAIRANAHLALQDLREVIGVLRHSTSEGEGEGTVPERPQPTLADLPALVEECRHAGMDVRLGLRADGAPEGLGRNLYRIVQEALTNARKHAGGAPVTVTVEGTPGGRLSVEVRNPLGPRHGGRLPGAGTRIPGAGAGLIGLTERAELAGGRLEHGATPQGEFLVRAWLPWPVETTREDDA